MSDELRAVRAPSHMIPSPPRRVADLRPGETAHLGANGVVRNGDDALVVSERSMVSRSGPIRVTALADGTVSVSVPHHHVFPPLRSGRSHNFLAVSVLNERGPLGIGRHRSTVSGDTELSA